MISVFFHDKDCIFIILILMNDIDSLVIWIIFDIVSILRRHLLHLRFFLIRQMKVFSFFSYHWTWSFPSVCDSENTCQRHSTYPTKTDDEQSRRQSNPQSYPPLQNDQEHRRSSLAVQKWSTSIRRRKLSEVTSPSTLLAQIAVSDPVNISPTCANVQSCQASMLLLHRCPSAPLHRVQEWGAVSTSVTPHTGIKVCIERPPKASHESSSPVCNPEEHAWTLCSTCAATRSTSTRQWSHHFPASLDSFRQSAPAMA